MTTKGKATIAAAASGQSQPHAARPGLPLGARQLRLWVVLVPEPISEEAVLVLAPGTSYVAHVTLASASPDEKEAFTVRGDLALRASWRGAADVQVTSGDKIEVSVSQDPDAAVIEQFQVDVSPDALRTGGYLVIQAIYSDKRGPEKIFEKKVEIAGELLPTPSGFAASAIRLDRRPDPRLAVLYVHGSSDQLLVDGFHPLSRRLEDSRIGRPDFDFVRAEKGGDSPGKIIRNVLDYSQRKLPGVHAWLNDVFHSVEQPARQQDGGSLAIIIVEQVDSRVPWEMLPLEDQRVLGERALVTRWIAISHYSRTIELEPTVAERGPVLSYVDVMEGELQALAAQITARWHEPCELHALVHRLKGEPNGLALVMLTCHGIFVDDPSCEGTYGSKKDKAKPIKREDLLEIAELAEPRPLVFVNACHSARLSTSARDPAEPPVGLSEIFLRRRARGYLGTIGAVSLDFAAEIGMSILEQGASPNGVCIPELLLMWRRAAAANRAIDPQRYLDTFMYVFYGRWDARLLLDTRAPGRGEHD